MGYSAFGGTLDQPIQWWGEFPGSLENGFSGVGFWAVFAVFFPASTGIMAGANMSGDLKNPRRSIPLGTMSAIALSLLIYLALAWWLAASSSSYELVRNYTIMIDKAVWGPAVLAGLLGATFSSALSSLVGAPRILQALAQHKILPAAGIFSKRTAKGEPRNSLILTGLIVLARLMLRDLNAVAPLITMFFLLTYLMINAVVVLEQRLELVSFRPLLRIPSLVPLLGGLVCLFAMVIVSPLFSLVSLAVGIVIHAYLVKKHLETPYSDVRSGLFTAMAEWAAKKASDLSTSRERTWKANLLVPIQDVVDTERFSALLCDLARPNGFVRFLGLSDKKGRHGMEQDLYSLVEEVEKDELFTSWTVVQAASFHENLAAGLEALGSAFFTSTLLFLRLPAENSHDQEYQALINSAIQYEKGVLLHVGDPPDPKNQGPVSVGVDPPKRGWRIGKDLGNMDLALLIGYKLSINRKARLDVATRLQDMGKEQAAQDFLEAVLELARMPEAGRHVAELGNEQEKAAELGQALAILPLNPEPDLEALREQTRRMGFPCIFALESGNENVLS